LSHYSKRTADIEYKFEFAGTEWGELEGIANRTDFDLKAHSAASGKDLSYFDQEKGERWTPYVIEPAAGVDRCTLTFLMDAFTEDEAPNSKGEMEKRAVLKLDHRLAPIKAAVLPLSRNADLSPKSRHNFARTGILILMTPVQLVAVTVVKMKSVLLIASPLTSKLLKIMR
jgi:glycyl-tRNA synthetase